MREGVKPQTETIFDGAYELLSTLGRGSRSIVYKARPLSDPQRLVALKVFTGSAKNADETIQRVKREALALLSSRHRNVVRVFDYVATHTSCYLAMEYAVHGDARQQLEIAGMFEPVAALKILRQLLSGLEAIHRVGIFHCDIKPENLLLTSNDEIKISDFGISILPTERRSAELLSAANGTLDYLAPELLHGGNVNETTDLYAAGVTFYQLLTNSLPFSGGTLSAAIESKLCGTRRTLGNVPGAAMIETLLDRALAPDPQARFQSAAEFREAAEAVLAKCSELEEAVKPQPAATSTKKRKRSFSWKRALVYSISSFLIGAGVVTGMVGHREIAVASLRNGIKFDENGLRLGFWEGIRQVIKPKQIAPFQKIAQLTTGTHVGAIDNMLEDGSIVPIMTRGIDGSNRFILSLGVPGWTPRTILLSPNAKSNELRINGNGLRLSLWINLDTDGDEGALAGHFREHNTGREGHWHVTIAN